MASKQSLLHTILLFALATCTQFAVQAQDNVPQWQTITHSLLAQRDAIKSLQAEAQFEMYLSPSARQAHQTNVQRVFHNQAPSWEAEPNQLFYHRWSVSGARWRDENRQIFPAKPEGQHPIALATFDGGKICTYDSFRESGMISKSEHMIGSPAIRGYLGNLDDNIYYSLSWLDIMEASEKGINRFVFEKEETIENMVCLKYTSNAKSAISAGRISYWVCPKMNFAVVRLVTEVFQVDAKGTPQKNGNTINLSARDFVQAIPGTWLPKETSRSVYDIRNLELRWINSQLFTITSLSVNRPLPDSLFDLEFPPGTMVSDEVSKTAYRVGGPISENYQEIKTGQIPPVDLQEGEKVPAFDVEKIK